MAKLYLVRITSKDKGVEDLTISASSREEAEDVAKQEGSVLRVKQLNAWQTPRALSSLEREEFLMQMAFLTESGLGAGQALATLQKNSSGRLQTVSSEIISAMDRGITLNDALARTSKGDFPETIQAIVRAGYSSGKGSEALSQAGQFEAELRQMSRAGGETSLISAMLGFLFALGVIMASTFYAGPLILGSSFVSMAGDAVDVQWAVYLSYALMGLMGALGLSGAVVGLIRLLRKFNPLGSDRLLSKIPIASDVFLGKERYLGMYSLSVMLEQPMEMGKIMDSVRASLPTGLLSYEIDQAKSRLEQGLPWESAFASLSPIERTALKGAATREQLSSLFSRIATQTKERYAKARFRLAMWAQMSAAISLVGAGGVLFAISTIPILQSSSSLM